MSGRRTIILGCTAALLIAAVGWFVLRREAAPPPGELGAVHLGEVEGSLTPIQVPPDANAPEQAAVEPARDVAAPGGAGLEAGTIDEFTADGLREEPKLRPRTVAIGRVIDEQDKPIDHARVLASLNETSAGAALDAMVNSGRVREVETDREGRFRLTVLDPGKLRVEVHAEGFAPLVAREFVLPPGEKTDLGDFRVTRGVVLAGRVVDSIGRVVGNARIYLVSAPMLGPVHRLGIYVASPLGTSDDGGQFELAAVALGKWTLLVRSDEHPETPFEVDAPADVARVGDLEFVLPPCAEIGGHILDFDEATMKAMSVIAVPEEGQELFSESKPPGATQDWLAGVQGAMVDPFGRFAIKALAPGRNYVLRAVLDSHPEIERDPELPDPWAPSTLVPAGEADAEVVYLPGCRLDFEVVDKSTGAKIERLRARVGGMWPEDPLRKLAHVPPDGESSVQSFFPGGRVSLLDLRATNLERRVDPSDPAPQTGIASLSIEAPGYDTVRMDGLRLEPGSTLDLGMVGLQPLPIFEVRVLDAVNGAPLAGARVELFADHPERVLGRTRSATLSDGKGFARLTSLPTIGATLAVSCPGYAPTRASPPGAVRFGAPPFEVALFRQARVTVIVRDTRGAAAGSVLLSMKRQEMPDRMGWSRTEITDATGVAVFTGMPGGVFDLAALSRNGVPTESAAGSAGGASAALVLQVGDDVTANLEVQALSSLSGTLWLGREPLARAQISVEAGSRAFRDLGTNMTRFSAPARFFTDAQGSFDGVELMPGVYSLLIEQSEHDIHTLRVVRVERSPTDVIIDIDDTAITGTVFDKRGDPVVGATVQLFADRPGRRQDIRPAVGEFLVPFVDYRRAVAETTTNALGDYRLTCVPPGIPLEMLFSSGQRAASIPRINAPQGTTLEGIDASLPDVGAVQIILSAPIAPHGLHYGVRIVAFEQPEGLAILGADFDENGRAHFDNLPPGRWIVMVFALDAGERVVERRQPQSVDVKAGQLTEFSVGW